MLSLLHALRNEALRLRKLTNVNTVRKWQALDLNRWLNKACVLLTTMPMAFDFNFCLLHVIAIDAMGIVMDWVVSQLSHMLKPVLLYLETGVGTENNI